MKITNAAKERLRIMFIAKHALGDGSMHREDGNHAVYHHEMRSILEGLGLNLTVANSFEALFEKPDVDFVFTLLNRAGFFNSEMLGPLLCTRHGIPFLGASPILRGLGDDKHLTKRAAAAAGVPTAPWAIYRRGAPVDEAKCPRADRYVIKPNASSASWGVRDASDWTGVRTAIEEIHEERHDAIVEPFLTGSDAEVPVLTIGDPVLLPMFIFRQADPDHLRTYAEKRELRQQRQHYSLDRLTDPVMSQQIAGFTRKLWDEFRPFDYGRFEFRVNEDTGVVHFLEVNLNCNLWSQKVFGKAAAMAGWTQSELIETILAESLRRQGLMG
ncbi:phosphoribosylglycinamide synthetase [Allopontixanthobacter sp.]|uniref:phosphoribosylglycinamide synthetase n=1 Tax=Allopontixanthobacter sp. TaxID=2906452 RepID=UPI002ABB90FC|nr:phosphoribosylglycinamide synthetase [Allopontixanthobacter sp.]MDZ4308047.1 phosphoribosylglycinamide synthetase [Allopontixanthobacter sp.]